MSKKIIVPPSENKSIEVSKFSNKISQYLNNTTVVDNGDGTESVNLELDDRIVTIIIDQSGSMTWNDSGNFRHVLAKDIIQRISDNYPGTVKYNLIEYGSLYVNMLFFGLIETDDINLNDLNSISEVYLSDTEARYAGVRVVRNIERVVDGETLTYPTSPVDGKIVYDGFISKVLEQDLETNKEYYYTIYTYDNDYKFSKGVNVKLIPKTRNIPKGVSVFKTIGNETTSIYKGNPLIGTGVIRDSNTVSIWHCNMGEGNIVYDFSDSKANLDILTDNNNVWLDSNLIPSGLSGLKLDGSTYCETDNTNLNLSLFDATNKMTIMFWLYCYDASSNSVMIANSNDTTVNYQVGISSNRLYFSGSSGAYFSDSVLENYKWYHCSVVISEGGVSLDSNNIKLYINGVDRGDSGTTGVSSVSNGVTSIGALKQGSNISHYFNGKITEISIHDIDRDIDYISSQFFTQEIKDTSKNPPETIVYNGEPLILYKGYKYDNGDRVIPFKYLVSSPVNDIILVKNTERIPTWEEDGEIINIDYNGSTGWFYCNDVGDFIHNKKYYYRIFTKNSIGNYSFPSDSSYLEINITDSPSQYLPAIDSAFLAVQNARVINGNKKVCIKWDIDDISSLDERVKRVQIYYSKTDYPVVNDFGCTGRLVFDGTLEDSSFVHYDLKNKEYAYYTLIYIDKYGRTSASLLDSSDIVNLVGYPEIDAIEDEIPVPDVTDVEYEILDSQSVGISWKQPVKNTEDINVYFDETVLFYASLTDQYGQPIPDDTLVKMYIRPNIERINIGDSAEVFGLRNIDFEDSDVFNFSVSDISNGIIKATLRITTDKDIISQIKSASFDIQVKSYIPRVTTSAVTGESASTGILVEYVNTLNDLLDIEENQGTGSSNIFEYKSQTISVTFSNPWELELYNRDDLKVSERCYFIDRDTKRLSVLNQYLDGVYMRGSRPFVARAKVKYKGEPVESGSVDVSIWEANANLCQCAGKASSGCYPSFTRTQRSLEVLPPSSTLSLNQGIEEDGFGNLQDISFVDIPIYASENPKNIILYVKGSRAGFTSMQQLPIVFQSILKIDFASTRGPSPNNSDIAEQQAISYIVNPDYPEDKTKYTYPEDNTIVEWNLEFKKAELYLGNGTYREEDVPERFLYSTDNVGIANGVYSYTRKGMARNVFLGPIVNENENIEETHEISATVNYAGLSDTVKAEVSIRHSGRESVYFGARFLMETEYDFQTARNHRLWTDGKDYIKAYISRNPNTSETIHSNVFKACAKEEDAPLLELNDSGQIVYVNIGEDFEIVHGKVWEDIDPYTDEKYLIIDEDEGFVQQGNVAITLNDSEISDTTAFYIRANKFCPGETYQIKEGCDDPNARQVNLDCFNMTECSAPLLTGTVYSFSGSTYLLTNGESLELKGGGNIESGVPPCLICVKEPLVLRKRETYINDDLQSEDTSEYILESSDELRVKVEVSWKNRPIDTSIPIYVTIGNNNGTSIFGSESLVVYPELNEDGRTYVNAKFYMLKVPQETVSEEINIFSTYDELGKTQRLEQISFSLKYEHEEVKIIEPVEPPNPDPDPEPNIEPSNYLKTLDRYNFSINEWEKVKSMERARGYAFAESVENKIYVCGGLEKDISANNDAYSSIVNSTEIYNAICDEWTLGEDMLNPRFAGMSVSISDKIYIVGGIKFNGENNELEVSRDVEVYDTSAVGGNWTSLESMPENYGIAFGTAQHYFDGIKNYIYILSGINQINNLKFYEWNDRVLRYCIEDDKWESSEVVLLLESYQRYSPLSVLHNDKIIVFNGGSLSSDGENLYEIFENYYIDLTDNFDFFTVCYDAGKYIANIENKTQSALALRVDNPSNENIFYTLGGFSTNKGVLDQVEEFDMETSPFSLQSTNNTSLPFVDNIPLAKYGLNAIDKQVNIDYNYLNFLGNEGNIEVPNNENLPIGNSSFTLEFWASLGDAAGGRAIYSKITLDTQGFIVFLNNGEIHIQARMGQLSTERSHDLSFNLSDYLDNKWHHYIASFDTISPFQTSMSLYIDGQLVTKSTEEQSSEHLIFYSENVMSWGCFVPGGGFPRMYFLDGYLGYMGCYNKVLDIDEIKHRYNSGIFKKYTGQEDGLVWATNLDSWDDEYVDENVIVDISTYNDGLLNGAENVDYIKNTDIDSKHFLYSIGGFTDGTSINKVDIEIGN